MSKKIILIDIDDTIFDTRARFLELYNSIYQKKYTFDELVLSHNYSVTFPKWEPTVIHELFQSDYLYDEVFLVDFSVIPELKKLAKEYELITCSTHNPRGIANKSKRLEELTVSKMITQEIYLSNDYELKSLINAYAIVDDRLDILIESVCPIKILYDKYNLYDKNTLPKDIIKINDWKEIRTAILWGEFEMNAIEEDMPYVLD